MKKLILALLLVPCVQMSYAEDKKDPKLGEQATTSSTAVDDSSRGGQVKCVKKRDGLGCL